MRLSFRRISIALVALFSVVMLSAGCEEAEPVANAPAAIPVTPPEPEPEPEPETQPEPVPEPVRTQAPAPVEPEPVEQAAPQVTVLAQNYIVAKLKALDEIRSAAGFLGADRETAARFREWRAELETRIQWPEFGELDHAAVSDLGVLADKYAANDIDEQARELRAGLHEYISETAHAAKIFASVEVSLSQSEVPAADAETLTRNSVDSPQEDVEEYRSIYRTWETADGAFEVVARHVSHTEVEVTLQRKDNDEIVTVPFARLSRRDHRYLLRNFSDLSDEYFPRNGNN